MAESNRERILSGHVNRDRFIKIYNLNKLESTPLHWLKVRIEILDVRGEISIFEKNIQSIELYTDYEPNNIVAE